MKKRNSNIEVATLQNGSGCCSSKPALEIVKVETVLTSCCEGSVKTTEVKPKTDGCC